MDKYDLLKKTGAFKIVKQDKNSGFLSHAYLLLTADKYYLKDYMKVFAKLIMCGSGDGFCDRCRVCGLIDKENFTDVIFLPEENKKIDTECVENLISESFIKPFEADRKLFLLCNAEQMNAAAQNKLLKTLEEPPKNVHILLGATNEFTLLPTVKSRVKKLEIPLFKTADIYESLKDDYSDKERLLAAINAGDGTVGKAEELYNDSALNDNTLLAVDLLVNMKTSRDVLKYSVKLQKIKDGFADFLDVLELLLKDMLLSSVGKTELIQNKKAFSQLKKAENFKTASIINCLEKINEAKKRINYNVNDSMLTEWLLFQLLEGKYKWQKL